MSEADDEAEELTPNETQENVIESETYPLRVLAGAGTGKTTTMVWKIESLVRDGVPPDEILALTFTNKAAAAMQEKVAAQLDDPERAYDITTTTYHAIANQLLTEHAYHAELPPEYEIADEVERSKLVYECLDEIPYRFTEPRVTEPDDTSFVTGVESRLERFISQFKSATVEPEALAEYLPPAPALAAVGELVSVLRTVADEQLYIHGNTTPNSLDPEQLEGVKAGLRTLLADIDSARKTVPDTDGGPAELRRLLTDLETVLSALQTRIEPLDATEMTGTDLDYARAPAYLLGQHGNPPGGLPEQDPRLIDRFEELVRDWQRASDLVVGYQAYQDRLQERGLLDYDDLIFRVLDLFEDETLGPRLRDRYQYVVCDEFQDTDEAQLDLVVQLVGDDELFLVGDDDQAIYEWRGANPSNIREDIDAAYHELQTETLERNYRSRPDILELANRMVESIQTRGSGKKLDPDREGRDGAPIATLADYRKEDEMERIGAAMDHLVAGTAPDVTLDVGYGDIAVLVRDNHHARDLLPVLERRDIPYELAGDLASNSVGIETVLAYLRWLAEPEEETHLNRILLLRYRLSESDLDRLHAADSPVHEALSTVPPAELTAPERARTAHEHLTELLSCRETHSLTQLYAEIKGLTDIDRFLTADEREELRYLDDTVQRFADEAIESPLSTDFIEHLRHSVSSLVQDESEGAEPSEEVLSILTVHKAKGLEFPVVFMPRVSGDTWGPSVGSHDRIRTKLDDTDTHPAIREEQEQRRVFHVGVTRAEDLLVLSTSDPHDASSDSEGASTFSWESVYASVPEESDLRTPDASFPVWTEVTDALPSTSVDWTELTDQATSEHRATEQERDTEGSRSADEETIVEWIEETVANDVDTAPVSELGVEPEALTAAASPEALRTHSYSAIDRYESCQRWHYLTNVVYAFNDRPVGTTGTAPSPGSEQSRPSADSDGADDRKDIPADITGTIFHETAERAAPDPNCTSVAEWEDVARDVAKQHDIQLVPERVSNCIANYHESKLAEWDIVSTERRFELNLGTHPAEERPLKVRGYIDAIYKHKGSYYVVDYKTNEAYSQDHRRQAKIYMLACHELLDNDVSTGYVYYLNRGPDDYRKVERKTGFGTIREQVRDALAPLNSSSYAEPTADDRSVCRSCPHNTLPCSKWPPEERR